MMQSFQELEVWQKAMQLAMAIYKATANFPTEERFGITSQLRRAALSIGANIAEGFGRHSTKDFLRYLEIAHGSLEETRHYLIASLRLGFLPEAEFRALNERCDEVGRLLGGLRRSLRKRLA